MTKIKQIRHPLVINKYIIYNECRKKTNLREKDKKVIEIMLTDDIKMRTEASQCSEENEVKVHNNTIDI